jgi:hypothetical protein
MVRKPQESIHYLSGGSRRREIVPLCTSTYCEAVAKPCAQLRVNATYNIEHSDLRRHATIGKIIPLVGSLWHSDFGSAIFRGAIPALYDAFEWGFAASVALALTVATLIANA